VFFDKNVKLKTDDIPKNISKSPVAECFSGLKMISSRMMFLKNVSKPRGPKFAHILFSDLSAWANRQVHVNDFYPANRLKMLHKGRLISL
jgi:hypothetical protein